MAQHDPGQSFAPAPRRAGVRRWVLALAVLLSLSVMGVVAGGWALAGRTLSAPEWLRAKVETRLASALPGVAVMFGDLKLRLDRDGHLAVILLDVDVQTADAAPIAVLSDIEIGLALRDVLRGQLVLRDLGLSGAVMTLTRDRSGRFGLALGGTLPGGTEAPDLPSMIARGDALLGTDLFAQLTAVEARALTVRFEDARARRGWTVDGGRLRITRREDLLRLSGDFALLSGGATAARLQLDATSRLGDSSLAFGMSLRDMPSQDIATQSPALAWLGALRAPISGSLRATMRADGALGPLNAALQIGAGVLQPNPDTPPIPFTSARSYFTYTPERAQIVFTEMSVESDLVRAVADGRATLTDTQDGTPVEMIGQVRFSQIAAAPDMFAQPLSLDRAEADFRLRLDPFDLDLGRVWVDDPAVPLRLSGSVRPQNDAWEYALDGRFGQLTPEALLRVWPITLAPRTRDWVRNNIEHGILEHGQFALRDQDGSRPVIYLNAGFEGAALSYADSLPGITDAAGTLTLHEDRFAVRLTTGRMTPSQGGDIVLDGSSFVIPDTRRKPARGQISLSGTGAITSVLAYLDSPPMRIMHRAGRAVDLMSGQLAFDGTLELPLRRGVRLPDMALALRGQARAVASDALIPGRALTADVLDLSVTQGQLRVSGQAALSGVPFEGQWVLPIPVPGTPQAGSTLEGRVTVSQEAARTFGIALPEGFIGGSGPAALRVDLPPDRAPEFRLTSDLAGLALSVPPIGWSLRAEDVGRFAVTGALTQPARIDRLSLEAPGLRASGRVVLTPEGSLDRVDLDRVQAGGWLDAPVVLSGRGAGLPPALRITGGEIDLRAAPFGGQAVQSGNTDTVPVALALDDLRISDNIRLTGFRADLHAGAGLTGAFTANVNAAVPITGEAVPVPLGGGTAFRLRSGNAGRVLRAAGIVQNVDGGEMTLVLTPVPGQPGSYDGALEVTNTRLRDAPGIASLLDAISIVGLLDQLEGPGILFTEVEARFRLMPDRLVVTHSSATGPSMGLSLDGTYDLGAGALDFQGVLSPIFFLNGIGSVLTRKGEGLIGFNFTVAGPVDQPDVRVNPLSALTPGIFRELFRRPPPELDE